MKNMVGAGQVQARAAGLDGQHKERRALFLLKFFDQRLARFYWRRAMQHESGSAEDLLQIIGERPGHFLELCEHQDFLLPCGNRFGDLAQASELATVGGRIAAIA